MPKNCFFLRPVSLLLLQTFLIQQFAFADVIPAKQNVFSKPEVSFSLPESIATIEDAWFSEDRGQKTENRQTSTDVPSSEQGLLVYLIQDAHTNESGQLNLAKTLDIILKKESSQGSAVGSQAQAGRILTSESRLPFYVFSEGGVNDNSLSEYRSLKSLPERKKIADEYLRKGLLHGTEYLDLTSNHNFILWGVETPALYAKSFHAYKAVAQERERFDLYLKKIESTINTLKDRLLNPSLLCFDKERQAYQKDKLSLTSYFDVLQREAYLRNIDLKQYPELKALKELKDKEQQIDFTKANQEQQQAVSSLSEEDQKELKDISDKDKNSPFKLSNQDHKGQKGFYALLEEKLKQKSAGPVAYPNLFRYFQYLKAAKAIEAKHVLDELKALDNQILSILQTTEDERLLIKSQEATSYLRKLFYFQMTPEDYTEYKRLTGEQRTEDRGQDPPQANAFTIEHLTGFLNKKIMDLGTYYERSLFLEPGYQEIITNAQSFYRSHPRQRSGLCGQYAQKTK